MSLINPAPVQKPIPAAPRRKLSTVILNFFLGNPVRAMFTCCLFWMILGFLVRAGLNG